MNSTHDLELVYVIVRLTMVEGVRVKSRYLKRDSKGFFEVVYEARNAELFNEPPFAIVEHINSKDPIVCHPEEMLVTYAVERFSPRFGINGRICR